MHFKRRITMALSGIGLAVFFSLAAAMAQDYNQLRILTEQGERASRAIRPSPPPLFPPNNGIKQFPVKREASASAPRAGGRGGGISPGQKGYILPAGATPPCPFTEALKTMGLEKDFPGAVTWHLCVTDMGMKGLWVTNVYLKRPDLPWILVLYQAGLADIFVPYHNSTSIPDPPWPNTGRFYDMRWTQMLN